MGLEPPLAVAVATLGPPLGDAVSTPGLLLGDAVSTLHGLAQAHAGISWAAVLVLGVSIVGVGRRIRGAKIGVAVAVGLGAGAFATGATLHMPFQGKLRQRLFLASNALGWLFERKEHAAFGAIVLLACAGCAMGAEALAEGRDGAVAKAFRRAAIGALAGALVFEVFALVVSVAAGKRVGF